jgi:hypothetical protein
MKHGTLTFSGLLECEDGRGLEAQVGLVVLSNLTNETLERKLADEQLGGFLVTTNFTESDGSGPEAMGLLDTGGDGHGSLASSLGSKLLTGGLATSGLAGGLLFRGNERSFGVGGVSIAICYQCYQQ